MKKTILLLVLVGIVSCGGSSDTPEWFAGNWSGTLYLSENTSSSMLPVSEVLQAALVINQNETEVVLDERIRTEESEDDRVLVYRGTPADDGFEAAIQEQLPCISRGETATMTRRYVFTLTGRNKAEVKRYQEVQGCSEPAPFSRVWIGELER